MADLVSARDLSRVAAKIDTPDRSAKVLTIFRVLDYEES
jgi:hypothetical protein